VPRFHAWGGGHHRPVGIVVGKLRQHRRQRHKQRDQHQNKQAADRRAVVHKAPTRVLPQAAPFHFQLLAEVFQSFAVLFSQHHSRAPD